MDVVFSSAVISDRLQAFTRRLDSDATLPGRLKIYSSPRPAAGQPPDGAIHLATLTFAKPSLDTIVGKVMLLLPPPTTLVISSGEALWGRFESGNGEYVADADVSANGGGGAIVIDSDTTMLFAGGELSVSLVRLQEP